MSITPIKEKTKQRKLAKVKKHVKKHPQDNQNKNYLEGLASGEIVPNARKPSENTGGWVSSMIKHSNPKKAEYLKKFFSNESRKLDLEEKARYLKKSKSISNQLSYIKSKKDTKKNDK